MTTTREQRLRELRDSSVICCMYCNASATRSDVHASGWRLAKSAPFHYVCPDIRCLAFDQARKEPGQ